MHGQHRPQRLDRYLGTLQHLRVGLRAEVAQVAAEGFRERRRQRVNILQGFFVSN